MPKQKLIIRDFSGGMNTKRDPRDIAENEFSYMNNFSIDAIGKLKTAGGFYNHIESNDGSTNLTEYISNNSSNMSSTGSGGFGAFYFESDHSTNNTQTITLIKDGGSALALGNDTDGTIQFEKTTTRNLPPSAQAVYETSTH